MAFEDLNAFIAEAWPVIQNQTRASIKDSLTTWRLKPKDNNSLQIKQADIPAMTLASPGITARNINNTIETMTIRLPQNGLGSLEITGILDGSTDWPLVHAVHNVALDLKITDFSLTIVVTIDHRNKEYPQLTGISISPSFSITSDILTVNLNHDQWVTIPNSHIGAVQTKIHISLEKLFPSIGHLHVDGNLKLDIFADTWLSFDTHILNIPVTIPFGTSLPDSIKSLVDALRPASNGSQTRLPRQWGLVPADFVEPSVQGKNWSNPLELPAQAADIEQRSPQSHLIDGLAFNLVYDQTAFPFELISYDDCRDSAIWTGHFLMAEAFHYAVTKNTSEGQNALNVVSKILDGIEKLYDIPKYAVPSITPSTIPPAPSKIEGLFCRAVMKTDHVPYANPAFHNPPTSPENKVNNYYTKPVTINKPGEPATTWYGFGRDGDEPSRDQTIGLLCGMGWACGLLRDQPEIAARIKAILRPAIDYILDNHWAIPSPAGSIDQLGKTFRTVTTFIAQIHQQLAILKIAAVMLGDASYVARYQKACTAAGELAWLPVWMDTFEPIDKYYKFNLDWNCVGILMHLEDNPDNRKRLQPMLDILRAATGHHRNAFFNTLWLLAQSTADLKAMMVSKDRFDGKQTVIDETEMLLMQWAVRTANALGPNHLPTQGTSVPALAWLKSTYTTPATSKLLQPYITPSDNKERYAATYALPVQVRPGGGMDFLWQRDPFSTAIKIDGNGILSVDMGDKTIEGPGIDFILPYWMYKWICSKAV